MLRSMTGFGEGAAGDVEVRIAVTARSVNHRYFDLTVRLPDELRGLEAEVEGIAREKLHRGRIEIRIDVQRTAPRAPRVELRTDLLRAVLEALEQIRSEGLVAGQMTPGDVLATPGVLEVGGGEEAEWTVDPATLRDAVGGALDALVAARAVEGERLTNVLADLLRDLEGTVAEIDTRRTELQESATTRLRERVGALLGDVEVDAQRLAQEVALLVERADVQEEIDRLLGHLQTAERLLERGGVAGRKLDFLMQEVLRELNTISSKVRDGEAVELVVDAKLLCEQLREQIQNVE